MNEITKIDMVLTFLKKSNKFVTINDISNKLSELNDNEIIRILNYLLDKNYISIDSNSYSISMEGVFFIEETPFLMKKHPFFYNKTAKNIRILALFINALTLLALSSLTFLNNKKAKHDINIYIPSNDTLTNNLSKTTQNKLIKHKDTVSQNQTIRKDLKKNK